MNIVSLPTGPLMTNCFIVSDGELPDAAVIDPGGSADKILMKLADAGLSLTHIINTHGHFDHVGANRRLKDVTGAQILIHALDAAMLSELSHHAAMFGLDSDDSPPADRILNDGDTINIGRITLTVLHTPGHTPGGISLYAPGVVFSGDALFQGSIGRTDFPGGDYNTLISSIKKKLFTLPDHTRVLSGHTPETTIGQEKRYNPFVGGA